ncbi:hypothetical protein H1R17_06580 [Flavobacterium sp. xlx-214]|uniref:hypothetical protein n=1 Tax=unclassified Flavobacterium TaxID=196869 RepID=UPI0013D20E91|nr:MULTISPECIES: hypothetical protein [unclassified Flavobacterium]MBA5792884.1 hypothetical protein [Flavobacterium sp. xlx-221]QMI84782.1 hypothetical protein H1R17_06580 [Flavobacterium sp. xlx-214]
MKNTLLFLFLIAFSFKIKAQIIEASPTISTNEYFNLLTENLIIPDSIKQQFPNQYLDLTVLLTITKSGSVFNPSIKNDSLQLGSNLKKVIEKLPKWNPKTENGTPVASQKAINLSIFIPSKENTIDNIKKAIPEQGMLKYYSNVMRKINIEKHVDIQVGITEIKMIATFIVEKDGSLTDIKIKRF